MSPKKVSSRMCHMCALFEWFWVISSDFWVIFLILSDFSEIRYQFYHGMFFKKNSTVTLITRYVHRILRSILWFWTPGTWLICSICTLVYMCGSCVHLPGTHRNRKEVHTAAAWKWMKKGTENLYQPALWDCNAPWIQTLSLFSLCILYHVRSALCQLSYMAQKQPWKTVFCFMKVFEFTKHTNTRKSEKQIYVQGNRV